MKHHHRWLTISMLLGIITVTETAWAVPVTMPAGSAVWMKFSANACDSDGDADCLGSNQLGPNPPNGIPLTTFSESNGTHATGFAEVYPNQARSYLSANTGAFMYISMLDAYTVHGTAAGPFDITVHLAASGEAQSAYQAKINEHWLYRPSVEVEIGTFDPSTAVPYLEQFRVTPFGSGNSATHLISGLQRSASAFTQPLFAETSYTRSVGVGDVFNLAYGVNSHISNGAVDLRNTAVISFDLPQGVYLTSALGGTFGAPVPVPAAVWLFGSGLLGLVGIARRKKMKP